MTFDEQLNAFKLEAARQQVKEDVALPPFYKMLLGMRLAVKPPMFWSFATLGVFFTLFIGLAFGAGFGALGWLISDAEHKLTPMFWCWLVMGSWGAGHLIAFLYWRQAKRFSLSW